MPDSVKGVCVSVEKNDLLKERRDAKEWKALKGRVRKKLGAMDRARSATTRRGWVSSQVFISELLLQELSLPSQCNLGRPSCADWP